MEKINCNFLTFPHRSVAIASIPMKLHYAKKKKNDHNNSNYRRDASDYLCYSQCIFVKCPYFHKFKEMDDYSRQTNQPKNESYDKTHNYSRLHTVM